MDRPDRFSVLIVAFRSRDTVPDCLAALARQTRPADEVWVLENGSPQGERLVSSDMPDDLPGLRFVESDTNLGFAGGNNHLAREAQGDWLVLLNPDAFASDDWLEQLEAATRTYRDVGLFGCTQTAAGHAGVLDGTGDVYHLAGLAYRSGYGRSEEHRPPTGEVFGPCGAMTLIRRELFERLGGFDESFFCYNEDVDLAFRARAIGERAIQLSEPDVAHLGYASSGRRSEFATYHGVRNRAWVFMKNMPGWSLWVLAPLHLGLTVLMWLSAYRFGLGNVFARAIRDAWADRERVWKQRREIQAERVVAVWPFLRMMAWNPLRLLTRASHIRPLKPRD